MQRKPKGAAVARLRKRDNDEFCNLRRRTKRWADDNIDKVSDPDPNIPEQLNGRAADNWRPLLAIADLAGGAWPTRARDAACMLSGEGHESSSTNVELLVDIKKVFGGAQEMRSEALVSALKADPELPWAEWLRGKGLTQKHLAGLLKPFGIRSETVHPPGQSHGKGYKRGRFEPVWERYCPGQMLAPSPEPAFEACKRGTGTSGDFRSVQDGSPHASKNDHLSYSHEGLHACTDRKPESGAMDECDHGAAARLCDHCGGITPVTPSCRRA
jgi:putative DNA primase/helicase